MKSWQGKSSVVRYLRGLKEYADRETVDVMFVTDNGIGFSQDTMSAVLSEGTPEKQQGSSGSFGVGHLTAFGLSGLQYILYGSKNAKGNVLASGHAVLSSHADIKTGKNVSHHGYLLEDYTNNFISPFMYCTPQHLSSFNFMKGKLDAIEGSGSSIAILGFNGFGNDVAAAEKPDLISDLILEAIATDFAIAILSGSLEVTVEIVLGEKEQDGVKSEAIDRDRIISVLNRKAEYGKKRESAKAKRTLAAIRTYNNDDQQTNTDRLEGKFRDCEIRLQNTALENDVSIWRNGMLISRDFYKDGISGKKPINAVVLLSGSENPREAHDLVQKAETPEHNKIEKRRLQKEERVELESFFEQIQECLANNALESGGKRKDLDDEISVDGGTASITPAKRKVFRVRDDEGDDEGEVPPKPKKIKRFRERRIPSRVSKANQVPAQVQGKISKAGDSMRVRVESAKSVEKSVLQFFVDGGVDASCTSTSVAAMNKDRLFVLEIEQEPGLNSTYDAETFSIDKYGDVVVERLEKGNPLDITLRFKESIEHLDKSAIVCVLGKAHDRSYTTPDSGNE